MSVDYVNAMASGLRELGTSIAGTGNDTTGSWGGLNGSYSAPESETLFSVLDPVATDGDTVGEAWKELAHSIVPWTEWGDRPGRLGGALNASDHLPLTHLQCPDTLPSTAFLRLAGFGHRIVALKPMTWSGRRPSIRGDSFLDDTRSCRPIESERSRTTRARGATDSAGEHSDSEEEGT